MLMDAMNILESKLYNTKQIMSKKSDNYKNEALFYLEENDFDYRKAIKEYKDDLNTEIQYTLAQKKNTKKGGKGGQQRQSLYGDESMSGHQIVKKKKKCEIF